MELNQKYQYYLDEFDRYIKMRNYRNSDYQSQTSDFINWNQKQGIDDISKIGKKEVYDYYEHLVCRPKLKRGSGILSDSSIHKYLCSIRMFFEFMIEEGYLNGSPHIPRHKISEKKETISLSMDEIKELYRCCKTPTEKALLGLAYGCGLRRTEIQDLKVNDINLYKKTLVVREGKNSKRREVPIQDDVLNDFKEYLDYRRSLQNLKKPVRSFFIGEHQKEVSGQTIYRWFGDILKRTKIDKKVTLHGLRHSLAEHLLELNAPIDFIRATLGHAMADTTQIYSTKNRMRKTNSLKIMKIK